MAAGAELVANWWHHQAEAHHYHLDAQNKVVGNWWQQSITKQKSITQRERLKMAGEDTLVTNEEHCRRSHALRDRWTQSYLYRRYIGPLH